MTPVLDRSVRLSTDHRGPVVQILDRRVFPHQQIWVQARSDVEVAAAIRDMVTQSCGPFYAALAAMALVAQQHAADQPADLLAALRLAAKRLTAARPTNNLVRDGVTQVLAQVHQLIKTTGRTGNEGTKIDTADIDSIDIHGIGIDTAEIVAAVEASASRLDAQYRADSRRLGRHAAALLADGARIVTHCWMDTYLIELVRAAAEAGKTFRYVATETRPYLQGARLTAHTLAEMDQQVTLITDGMVAAVLSPFSSFGPVDALVTAADRVSMDGHVFNKVGTLGAAISANAFDVPFYALVQAPDRLAPTARDVVVEERDGAEVLSALTVRTASPLVRQGHYPAFDVTPPRFVTRVVTDRGSFRPTELAGYYDQPRTHARDDRTDNHVDNRADNRAYKRADNEAGEPA